MALGRNTAAGFRNLFMGFTDDDGILIGSSPTRPANGTGSGMMRVYAAKRAPATVPNDDVVIAEGDDGEIITEYSFKSIASRGFVVEVAAQDLTIAGSISNVPVRSLGRGQYVALDRTSSPIYNVALILQSRSTDTLTGAKQWSGVLIPRATAKYLGRQEFNERTAAVFRFFITPVPAGYSPLGYSYLDNNNQQIGLFYDEFKGYPNPICMQAFTGDGIVTAVPVALPPINHGSPIDSAVVAVVPPSGQGATAVAVSSVSNSAPPYTVTPGSTIAVANRAVILYEFQQ